jgi:hypothetical protein
MGSSNFFDRVARARDGFAPRGHGAWYRGVKKRSYPLLPSYLRPSSLAKLRGKEHNLMARFTRQGARYLDTNDKWERLAFMQHYGVPTKLMDWTTNLTAALYFALAFRVDKIKELDRPCIWMLNPFVLNGRSFKGPRKIFDSLDGRPELKLEHFNGENAWELELPIAVAVDWRNSRIAHQQGMFTYHGTNEGPLDKLVPNAVKRIDIEQDEIPGLLNHLRDAGVTHHLMLQDPDSLGRDITEAALGSGLLWADPDRMPSFFGNSEEKSSE